MDYFLIFQCAMLLAGKTEQQEVVLQEEVVHTIATSVALYKMLA